MKRSDLNAQLTEIKNKISELEKKRFKYFIHGKYIPGFGTVGLLNSTSEVVKAFNFVKSQFTNDDELDSIESELGIKNNKKEKDEQLFMGFALDEWKEEFTSRVQELQNQENIEMLKKSLKKLKGYRTEEEKFEEDASKFSSLFTELGIDVSKKVSTQQWEDVVESNDDVKQLGE